MLEVSRLRWRALACAGMCAVVLTGCVGRDVEAPEARTSPLDMPRHYAGDAPSARSARSPAGLQVWWRQYHTNALTHMIEQALTDNLDIAAARARIQQAQGSVMTSRAPLLPQVAASGSATRARRLLQESDALEAGLNGSWALDIFGRNLAALEAAQASLKASEAEADVAALSVSASIASTYFRLTALQERLNLAQRNASTASRVLKTIRNRAQAGTTSGLEEAQQETLVANQQAVIPVLRQQSVEARNALAVLMGRAPTSFAMDATLMPKAGALQRTHVPMVPVGLPSDLLTRRADLYAAHQRLAALGANVQAAKAAFFPSIALTAQGGYQSTALVALFRPENALFSLAASLSQTIFDGGTLHGQLQTRQAQYSESLISYRKSVLTAFADVENALAARRNTAEQVQRRITAVNAARRAFRITDERLEAGVIDLVILLNAQATLFSAEDALVQARLEQMDASVALYQALGGGWNAPQALPSPSISSAKGTSAHDAR